VARRLGSAASAIVLHEAGTDALPPIAPTAGDVVLVVGPEGGIAPDELDAFEAVGAHVVRLGEPVLRTSTAGAAGLAALSVLLGRWRTAAR
jgi:16S rRNA (uracil1498-N3)-methyltransferase